MTVKISPFLSILKDFNSHAHVERDEKVVQGYYKYKYFNSHAHVERDVSPPELLLFPSPISTHTLTWSVTTSTSVSSPVKGFQLTRSRGA